MEALSLSTSEALPFDLAQAARWSCEEAEAVYRAPLPDLLYAAQTVHRRHFAADRLQLSTLLNIKSGGCPEDCAYCPQSARHRTATEVSALLPLEEVVAAARRARTAGATRFCMGAAWRSPRARDLERVAEMVAAVKGLGLETCATLGMLDAAQARRLKAAGLDYYNHNLDTSPEHYGAIITTRRYQDRLATLRHVREAGLRVCCGGIVGLGESVRDRVRMLLELAAFPEPPESVPINALVAVPGTPLADAPPVDAFDMVRTIALARILLPKSYVRLSAGRAAMSRAEQALCFLAGANSVFYGERLLTTGNPQVSADHALFADLGLRAEPPPQ